MKQKLCNLFLLLFLFLFLFEARPAFGHDSEPDAHRMNTFPRLIYIDS
jgi:hypothetical protein